jgi:hypothetical protein
MEGGPGWEATGGRQPLWFEAAQARVPERPVAPHLLVCDPADKLGREPGGAATPDQIEGARSRRGEPLERDAGRGADRRGQPKLPGADVAEAGSAVGAEQELLEAVAVAQVSADAFNAGADLTRCCHSPLSLFAFDIGSSSESLKTGVVVHDAVSGQGHSDCVGLPRGAFLRVD